jgi:EmrB/QacA subfamily drug resistance transporter
MTSEDTSLATRRGKLTLALLCAVAFLDFVDATIVNVALPTIKRDLDFSVQSLQWVASGYLLTYGGFMLLGGRAADLLGRRRVLVPGTILFALASLTGGLSDSAGMLVGARLVQGIGAAMMLPAALSILTTTFRDGPDRNKALGVWGAMAGLASAVGVLAGGALSEGPGWRWVLWVNLPVCVAVLVATFRLIAPDPRRATALAGFDIRGALLATTGMLLLVFTLVEAPGHGWGSARTLAGLAGALALLAAFLWNEARSRNPLAPLAIFRVRGLAAANLTQLIAVAGFIAMFYFLTLYMQTVLGWSQIQAGLAGLPTCVGVVVAAGAASAIVTRIGTRPVIVGGALTAAAGVYLLSRITVDSSYAADLLPAFLIMSLGLGAVFVANTTAANAGVPADRAGLAAALLNTSQQLGGALGLAVLTAIATSHTNELLAAGTPAPEALTPGFGRALLVSSILLVAAALSGLRTNDTREVSPAPAPA